MDIATPLPLAEVAVNTRPTRLARLYAFAGVLRLAKPKVARLTSTPVGLAPNTTVRLL